jgi:phosphatidate cytidylyltransferase
MLGILLAVWSADTGALFGGRFFGGPKLVPTLSPNKTWAGFICGTFAAGLVEALFVGLLGGSAVAGLSFGVIIALVGHAGDLFESWVKRRFQAKDSGALIPGHGGVLDRIDSLLFVAPVCAFLVFFAGLNPFQGPSP